MKEFYQKDFSIITIHVHVWLADETRFWYMSPTRNVRLVLVILKWNVLPSLVTIKHERCDLCMENLNV